MSADLTPAEVAVAFTKAWTSHDLRTAAEYLADDVVYEGPVNRITGSGPYMRARWSVSRSRSPAWSWSRFLVTTCRR